MATKEVTLKLDQWDIQSELVFVVDDEKFTETLATEINSFWSGEKDRIDRCGGSVIKAALRLYARECFDMVACKSFVTESYVTNKFDWNEGYGVEGFPSFAEAGLTLKRIDSFGIEFEDVSFADE
jgi:hypothetical protein